jgi:putative ABC transport system permease protein
MLSVEPTTGAPVSLFSMAWRNVWRNTRRSGVTIAAMSLGLWVMVLYSGLVRGMIADMATSVTDLEMGEVQIVAEGYREDPALHLTLSEPEALLSSLDGLGFPASARLVGGGLAAVGKASAGVGLIGLDPGRDARVSALSTRVDRGAWLDPADPRGVVIGGKLCRALECEVGDELILLSQGVDGGIANDLYTVRGTLHPVGDGIDRSTVLMNEEAFRDLMGLSTGVHQVLVRVPQGQDLDLARDAIARLAPGAEVRTWKQLAPLLAQWLQATESILLVVHAIMYLAIAILVLNAMLMAVFERIREFGVMKAIGYGPAMVFWLIALESAVQVGLATGVGLSLALPAGWYLQTVGLNMGALAGMNMMGLTMMENWRASFDLSTVVVPVGMLWFMVAGAAAFPALRAAAISPVRAMRYR